jgi:hypothetical protein
LQVHSAAEPFTSATCAIILSQNHFPESNRHMLNFLVEDHILSTTGDARRLFRRLMHEYIVSPPGATGEGTIYHSIFNHIMGNTKRSENMHLGCYYRAYDKESFYIYKPFSLFSLLSAWLNNPYPHHFISIIIAKLVGPCALCPKYIK